MSDKYFTFENFKYGLDARKSALNEIPGTLQTATNCFVNSGGELEQRKSFAQIITSVHNDLPFPTNCFGLQDTDSGLKTFGSDAAPNASLPTGVTYLRCTPPGGGLLPSMVSVVFSCTFKGKAFVLAKYNLSGNPTFAYYNGVLVPSSTNGLLTAVESLAGLSTDLAAEINGVIASWLAHANVTTNKPADQTGYNETAQNGSTLIMSPSSIHFTPVTSAVSTNGIITAFLPISGTTGIPDQNFGGIPGAAANASFQLTGGAAGSVTVTAPLHADGTGTAQLTNGAVNFDTSLAQTAIDIVNAINGQTYLTGYSARSNGVNITVFAPLSFGNFTFNLTVTVVTITVGAGAAGITVSLSPSTISTILTSNRSTTIFATTTASVSGATGAISFVWVECNADGSTSPAPNSGITLGNASSASATFSKLVGLNASVQGFFKVTATDAGTTTNASQVIAVYFELDGNQ